MHRNGKSHFEITCALRNGGIELHEEECERNVMTELTVGTSYSVASPLVNTIIKKSSSDLSPPTILTLKICS